MPLLSGLFSLANGIGQSIKGHQMHPQRPDYEIPEETKRALGLRQLLLNAGLPGEQQYRQDIGTNQSNAISNLARGVTDQSQLLSGLGAIQGRTNDALNQLETEKAQNYYQNVAGLERAQQNMANAEDKAFQMNEYMPYLMQLQQKYQLQNAGNQNISNGLAGLEAGAMDVATGGLSGLAKFFAGGGASQVAPIQGGIGFQPMQTNPLGGASLAVPNWLT